MLGLGLGIQLGMGEGYVEGPALGQVARIKVRVRLSI